MGRAERAELYIGNACLELRKIATATDLSFLAYLLDMAALEAIRIQTDRYKAEACREYEVRQPPTTPAVSCCALAGLIDFRSSYREGSIDSAL